jgi:hypothetical protein
LMYIICALQWILRQPKKANCKLKSKEMSNQLNYTTKIAIPLTI